MVGKRPHTSFHTHPSATTFSSRFLFWKNESEAFPPWEGFWAPPSVQKRGASIPTRREGAGLRLQYRASEKTAGLSQQQTARHCVSERFLSESAKGPLCPQPFLRSPNNGSLNAHMCRGSTRTLSDPEMWWPCSDTLDTVTGHLECTANPVRGQGGGRRVRAGQEALSESVPGGESCTGSVPLQPSARHREAKALQCSASKGHKGQDSARLWEPNRSPLDASEARHDGRTVGRLQGLSDHF